MVAGIAGHLARHNLALVYRDLGDRGAEEEQWRRIVEEKPHYRPGWHALGDVLLVPPQTAASLVGAAVTAGLRDSGYRVLEPNDPGYASAAKVNVRIVEFWSWVTPGFAQIKLDNVTQLVLDGNVPALAAPVTISVRDTKGYGAIFESDWGVFVASILAQVRELVAQSLATEPRS